MFSFFTDPVLRGPTIGSMLMCLSASLIGCLVFLQKRSLIGEALAHSAYPGVVLSVIFTAVLFPFSDAGAAISILLGAFITGLLGLAAIHQLEKRVKMSSDAALCFVLSMFFGVGILFASRLQVTNPLWFRQIQVYLFGQAATMGDVHIFLYGTLSLFVVVALFFLFRYLEILNFDPSFAKTVGMPTRIIHSIVYFLLVLSIVVGMRSVGVILMSGMLIAPAAAARQWVRRLGPFFALAGLLGMGAGFLGNVLSVMIPKWVGQPNLPLPTGPMIVLSATAMALFSLFFAPQKGLVTRLVRIGSFQLRTASENVVKALYKGQEGPLRFWVRLNLHRKGWVKEGKLTKEGRRMGEKLIRLHRLWEVYLVHMGQQAERVHHSAEEMEHILTSEIEEELAELLGDPKHDPHAQPIPGRSR